MSAWGDMMRRGAGEEARTEDKYLEELKKTEVLKKFKNILDAQSWIKEYYDDVKTVKINKEYIDEIGDFHWDKKYKSEGYGDYYVIDHLSQL